MTKFQKASFRVWLLIAALLLAPIHVLAGDSTSFTRSTVTAVAPSGGAVPVGTVIIWPFTSNPVGWSEGKWLECNGQAITSSAHPELYALGYTAVPDFRNRTLWGNTTPRTVKAAGLPNISASIETRDDVAASVGQFWRASGAFSISGGGGRGRLRCTEGYVAESKLTFTASNSNAIYGKSTTVQPPALTTRFLIRAKS